MRKNKQHPCKSLRLFEQIYQTKQGLMVKKENKQLLTYRSGVRSIVTSFIAEIIVVKLRQTMIRVKLGAHMLFSSD